VTKLLEGAFDLHVHTRPDVIARRYTDLELATIARDAGMRGVVLKCHHESTVGRAAAAAAVTGIEVLGGLVLNDGCSGGVRPEAVDTALRLGGKIVWWPTVTSAAHLTVFGGVPTPEPPVDKAVLGEIFALVAEHDAVFATGHAAKSTVRALAELSHGTGARLLVTHADFWIPELTVSEQAELARDHPHVWFERCAYGSLPGTPRPQPVGPLVEAIAATGGPARNVVSSDLGQPELPPYVEGLTSFAAMLVEAGLPAEELRALLSERPTALLGLAG